MADTKELVRAVRAHAEAHKREPGWRGILSYSDYELQGVLLVGCESLADALRELAPIVAAYAGHEAARAGGRREPSRP